MELPTLIPTFDLDADALATAVRRHPRLAPFFALDFDVPARVELRAAYLRLLKVKADYVSCTVPMLRAAGEALRDGDAEDRVWSERFLCYAGEETDSRAGYGHDVWARNDMRALGAPSSHVDAPPHPWVLAYRAFFVDDAPLHPYAILGAKGVLEHLSVRISDALVRGVKASGIEYADDGTSFFAHHGILDIDHVRAGDANLHGLTDPRKRQQVVLGAFFTSGCYRAFLQYCV